MWSDPDWEEMLQQSELIALVEVLEGGKYVAKVKPLASFKGTAPTEFYVTEFNNLSWPKDAIATESFKQGERYYLFLVKRDQAADDLAFFARTEEAPVVRRAADFIEQVLGWRPSMSGPTPAMQAAKAGLLWSVWTPTAGDLLVDGETIRVSLLRTTSAPGARPRDRAVFERFLRSAIAFHGDGQTDAAFLAEALQAIRIEAARPAASQDDGTAPDQKQPSELSHQLAAYFLSGGRAYDPVFERIAAGEDANARFILARLLGSIAEESAGKVLLGMLDDADSIVQGEVVRKLARRDPEQMGPILLAHLANAGEGGIGPRGLMDPVRNRLDGGKLEIIRALGDLKYEPAAPALTALLANAQNADELKVLAEALEKLRNQEYGPALEQAVRSGKMTVFEIADWAREQRVMHLKPAFERLLKDPPEDTFTIHLSSVAEALGAIGDDATAALLTERLERLAAKKTAEIHDDSMAGSLIGALAALRYKPARAAVEQSFFWWFGIDSTFAENPQLLAIKNRLEGEIERKAVESVEGITMVSPQALVFLDNRRNLQVDSASDGKYRVVLEVKAWSGTASEAEAEALLAHLTQAFAGQEATIGAAVQNFSNFLYARGANDPRVEDGSPSLFVWRYAQYVGATRDPADLRLLKFLVESGLAKRWHAEDSIVEGFGPIAELKAVD